MPITFHALPTQAARDLQTGGLDAYGFTAEKMISDGAGNPCRHCLNEIPEGKEMLVLAYRPFPAYQPYAETGPIFLCAEPCDRASASGVLPVMFRTWESFLLRGYTSEHRIQYGTGQVVRQEETQGTAEQILRVKGVAYVHMRSATNNCYQCRIELT